jgi:hypothetical protein
MKRMLKDPRNKAKILSLKNVTNKTGFGENRPNGEGGLASAVNRKYGKTNFFVPK